MKKKIASVHNQLIILLQSVSSLENNENSKKSIDDQEES